MNLHDWIIGETADRERWCMIRASEPACVIWLAGEHDDGMETDDIETRIHSLKWLGKPGDIDETISEALDVLAIYDSD